MLFRLLSPAVLSLILLSSAFADRDGNRFAALGGRTVETNDTLIFGGSFSPPTLEHMGIVAQLMARFGFAKAKMVVALPYKKGAAPADVSLGLTKTAIENFDEVLEIDGIPFHDFENKKNGSSSWTGKNSKRFSLEVEDYDIRTGNKENALKTLTHLKELHGDARKNFFVSGGDSFGSVPNWTPQWHQLFEQANWVVISRPGFDQGETAVNFHRKNPLSNVLGKEFIANYNYYFDQTNQTHVYRNKDSSKPDIYVINQPSLEDSSSKNRDSLKEPGDHEHAQAGLQPSVFKECVEKGYYAASGESAEGYKVFTRKNLETYLQWTFNKAVSRNAGSIDEETQAEIQLMSQALVEIAGETVKEAKAKPWVVGVVSHVYEHVIEHLSELKNIRQLGKTIRKVSKEYGLKKFGAVYVALEIAEMTVIPPLMYLIGGKAGLALSPFMHPNEFIVMPSFIGWNILKKFRQRKQLAGDYALFRTLTNYRNKLLRGDPEAIVYRRNLREALGLGGESLTINIVKSRLPKWIPLFIRRWDDKRVTWHDLNLSTNELKAMLGDSAFADQLKESAEKNESLFAHYLLTAVLSNEQAKLKLELFSSQRYFKQLYFGQIPEELLGGFKPAERKAIQKLRENTEKFRELMGESDRAELADLVSDFYAISRQLQLSPELASETGFWTTVIDLMATRYPDKKFDAGNQKARARMSDRLAILAANLKRLMPDLSQKLSIVYDGKHDMLSASSETKTGVLKQTFDNAVASYLDLNREAFEVSKAAREASLAASDEILPLSSRGTDLKEGNLIWDMQLYLSEKTREFKQLDAAFERAILYLETQERHKRAEKTFIAAFDAIEDQITAIRSDLRVIEYDWLKLKYPHQLTAYAKDEAKIEGHDEIVARYDDLQARYEERLDALRTLSQMMFGSVVVDLKDIKALRLEVGEVAKVTSENNRLGMGFCEGLLARRPLKWLKRK